MGEMQQTAHAEPRGTESVHHAAVVPTHPTRTYRPAPTLCGHARASEGTAMLLPVRVKSNQSRGRVSIRGANSARGGFGRAPSVWSFPQRTYRPAPTLCGACPRIRRHSDAHAGARLSQMR